MIELRVEGRVAFCAGVASRRPDVKVSVEAGKKDTLQIAVEGSDLEVRIVAKLTDGRQISPAARREGDTHMVDLTSLEGLGDAEILVEATSGCRTSRVVATRVTLPDPTVRGLVVEPRRHVPWPWSRRGSLIATVFDRNGRKIDWDQSRVAWRVDGELLKARTQIAAWQPQEAGAHQLELVRDLGDGQVDVLDARTVTVSEQTAEQRKWVAAMAARVEGGVRAGDTEP